MPEERVESPWQAAASGLAGEPAPEAPELPTGVVDAAGNDAAETG